MGNDGGSIPKRRELVREAARAPSTTELKQSQNEAQEYYWTTDPLSQQPLKEPIVSDCNGRLYNKDSVLEYLLGDDEKRATDEKVLHGAIKSLKDVVNLTFHAQEKEGWTCPVTNERLGPAVKAVYLVPCGHVFAASAVKEIQGETCVQCSTAYAENDVVPILPTAKEDIARLQLRMKTLGEKGLAHNLKKVKGEGKKKRKHEDAVDSKSSETKKKTAATDQASSGIKNSATASITAKVMQEQEEKSKRRKAAGNDNIDSLFSKDSGMDGKNKDFMTRGFAIPAKTK